MFQKKQSRHVQFQVVHFGLVHGAVSVVVVATEREGVLLGSGQRRMHEVLERIKSEHVCVISVH